MAKTSKDEAVLLTKQILTRFRDNPFLLLNVQQISEKDFTFYNNYPGTHKVYSTICNCFPEKCLNDDHNDMTFAIKSNYPHPVKCTIKKTNNERVCSGNIEWLCNGFPLFPMKLPHHPIYIKFHTDFTTPFTESHFIFYNVSYNTPFRSTLILNDINITINNEKYVFTCGMLEPGDGPDDFFEFPSLQPQFVNEPLKNNGQLTHK
jgi:hypothetical protein